ncbi:MAG: DUF2807 domain-containing protein [Bacteroidales bacterium]|nr:DUF2807 domain-containing protein [Bacteroidales bacterium]
MKRRLSLQALLIASALLIFSSCDKWNKVDGNYNVTTESRQVDSFNRVINEGNFDVYIIQDGTNEVFIEAESNLIPLIRTRVQGSALIIDTRDFLRNHYPMKLFIHVDDITEAKLSGSGLLRAENITAGELDVSISGSGYIFFSGTVDKLSCNISGSGSVDIGIEADELNATISGSGDMDIWGNIRKGVFKISGSGSIKSYELLQKECYATISGSGSMYLTVEEYLDVNISGSGNIYYMGNPVINVKISGSGKLIHP